MGPALLSTRERVAWIAGFAAIAALIVATRFESHDADSVRYATISSVLSTLPMSRWIAPEWWGLSPDNPLTGYFLEHPAGLFFIPALLGRLGTAPDQAPYIFGVGVALLALLLTAKLVGRLVSRAHGRAALVLLQVMPVAFIFRVRDNHEYPMLVCLLVVLLGLDGVSRSWRWAGVVALGLTGALLVKGVFVAMILLAAGIWILVNPTRGSRARQVAACAAGVAAMGIVALGYDAWYARVTGGPFWTAYWNRQLGPMAVASPFGQALDFARHVAFYAGRLLFHPAPWSLALVWGALRARGARRPVPAGRHVEHAGAPGPDARGGLQFAVVFTVVSVLLLSLASRFAERYAFSTVYVVAAAGVVAAMHWWPVVPRALARLERAVPALPVVVWIVLVGSRLLLGEWLPRI